jgi:hypothetical protein
MFEYVPGDASRQRHQYPELMDLRWPSMGGTLVDGNGDLATTLSPLEEMGSMVMTRMKGALDAWKLYPGIGADLDSFRGSPVGINQDTELSIQRAVTASAGPSTAIQTRCLSGRAT